MRPKESNRKNQVDFEQRKRANHVKRVLWIARDLDGQIEQLALANDWIATSGCKAGNPSMQLAITEVLKAGVEALEVRR